MSDPAQPADANRILDVIQQGDRRAAADLLPLVYQELRELARRRLAREAPGQTLQATALVHEAYLRLVGPKDGPKWADRGHFLCAAAEAMRRILIEAHRRKHAQKRGGARRARRSTPTSFPRPARPTTCSRWTRRSAASPSTIPPRPSS